MFNDFEVKFSTESNWELKYVHVYQGLYISDSENEYKKKNFKQLNEKDNIFEIEEKETDNISYFVLNIKSSQYDVKVRSSTRISLEYLIYHATMSDLKDIGRPLTFYPHLSNVESPLEEKRINQQNYRGFINLIILALILSHLRLMYENYLKYGIMVTPKIIFGFLTNGDNVMYGLCIGILILNVSFVTFLIELFASKRKNNLITNILHIINLSALLTIPLLFHRSGLMNPLNGIFGLSLCTVLFLKLYSYIHFWYDVRIFIKNKARLIKTDKQSVILQHDIYREIDEVITNYPKNLTLTNLVLFLFMPVLCYQYKYPRTQRIRKSNLLSYFLQFFICIIVLIFIAGQYMLPTIQNSMKFFKNDDYINIIERILKLAIPNVYGWIIMFYAFFHSWLNLLAELTKFGDRKFYKDWWNSLYLDEYWRTWNLPTHYWLMRHVYNPLRRRKVDKVISGGTVFFISAVFHEYIISGALGYVNYWAFIAMFANFPISILQEMMKRIKGINKQSQLLNVSFWISFCFFGQPLCLIIYFYNYYNKLGINI